MQTLGTFHVAEKELAPVLVAICFRTSTQLPQFVLAQECDTEVPYIKYGSTVLEVNGLLNDVQIESTQPSDGGGLIRRSTTLSIVTDHTKGYPFYNGPLDKKFYQAGTSTKDFYFAVYAVDRRKINKDIKFGLFFGYFQIQSGVGWREKDGITTLPLIDIFTNEDTLMAATAETIPDSFFLYNPWFNSQVVPKVYGQVARIKLLNSFPSFSTRKLASSIGGRVESTYTSSSTTIILEKNADYSSSLRQIISIGGSVRVKMADSEVILGTLAYDSGTGNVTLTVTTRNTYYAKALGYTYAMGSGEPSKWVSTPSVQNIPQAWSMLSSVILDGKNRIQDPNGWMQADCEFFDDSPTGHHHTATVATQMQGWESEEKGVIRHLAFEDGGINSSLSFHFGASGTPYGVVQTAMGPVHTWTWVGGQYLTFLSAPKEVKLYFRPPTATIAGGAIGDAWSLVSIEPASVTYECYIRNGFSHFSNDHVFCEGDGRLIKIPTGNIVSVTDSTTVSGLANMAKIVLTAAPMDMNIGATSNVVYTDALYKTGTSENRTERILYELLKDSAILQYLVAANIASDYTVANWLPYVGVLINSVTSVTALVDRLLFQIGATLRTVGGLYYLSQTGHITGIEGSATISSIDCVKPVLNSIDQNETLLESASIDMGMVKTKVDSNGYEFIPLYLNVDYGAWQDPYYKPVKPNVNRAIKPYERKFDYAFDLIQDPASANYAVGSSLSIGHPSGFATIERTLSIVCTLYAARFEALDPIIFKNFPLISTADETNALFATDGTPCYARPPDNKKFIMGAVCQLSKVVYNFSLDNPGITLDGKMAQLFTQANGVGIYKPPFPPSPPPSPPTDPNIPPNPNGGTGTGYTYGGDLELMPPVISSPSLITINSLTTQTTTFTISVDSGWLWTGGWRYYIDPVWADGIVTSGFTITTGSSGLFATKTSDSYVAVPITVTCSVTYLAFQPPIPTSFVSRIMKLRIMREALTTTDDSGDGYELIQTVEVPINLTPVQDIGAT